MISIIICSRSTHDLAAVSDNIAETIGVEYELISIDNSSGKYGICEAYNIGAAQAQYDVLCFMHEDIRFRTVNWGNIVANTLFDTGIGVLGVTGGQYQLAAPAAWWGCGTEMCRENVLNLFEDGHTEMNLYNPEGKQLVDVAVVDGLWMCSRKDVWQQYPFDARTFSEFHFYDVDYCTELFKRGYRICVTFDLLIEHHSRGSVNTAWLHNALKYQKKRRGQLPFGVVRPSHSQRAVMELRAMQEFTGRIIRAGFPKAQVLSFLGRCLLLSPFNRDTLWLVKLWLSRA